MTTVVELSDSPDISSGFPTIASLSYDWSRRAPDQVAMREKDFGIWKGYSWSEVWRLVHQAAHGLLALGVGKGDRVSIQSEDRPEWVVLDIAAVAIRAVTVGMYPTNPAAEVDYLLSDSGSLVHFAEDQEQVDKILEQSQGPIKIRTIIYVEPRGVRNYDDNRLMFWEDFLELGRRHMNEHPNAVFDLMAKAQADDLMTLVYTSGTTGPPKGAMLTNANAQYAMDLVVNVPGRTPDGIIPNPNDTILTYLPLCHVAERIFSTWTMVISGAMLNYAESIETVQENLREIQPTLFFAVPRIWEKMAAIVEIKSRDATRIKRLVFAGVMKLARSIGRDKIANGGFHTAKSRVLYAIGYPLVFRALKERLGMRRVRWSATGAAPIAPEVIEFFTGIGVPMYELYGMTENSAVATLNFAGRMKLGTVGEPYPGIGLRIDDETGEIQTKHPGVFLGYWNNPTKTAEAMTADGWLRTGDVGEWVDGTHVKIIDRIKDIIITAGGKNVSPSEIENSLKASPMIKEAMVIGDGRKFLSALIAIEFDVVGDWATRRKIPYTTYRDLSEKPEVLDLVQSIVTTTNEKFSRVENVRKFRMIPKELDHEDGELTATQKLKRSAMVDAFTDLVESMYL